MFGVREDELGARLPVYLDELIKSISEDLGIIELSRENCWWIGRRDEGTG